jgi:hypothetical protein
MRRWVFRLLGRWTSSFARCRRRICATA